MVKDIQQLHEVIQNKIVKRKHFPFPFLNVFSTNPILENRPYSIKKNTNHIRYDGKALSKNKHGKLLCEAVTILLFPFPFNLFSFPLPWS